MKIAAGFRKSRRAEISNIFLSPLGNVAKVVLYPLFILRSRHVRSANAPLRKANPCNVLVCLYIYSINKIPITGEYVLSLPIHICEALLALKKYRLYQKSMKYHPKLDILCP